MASLTTTLGGAKAANPSVYNRGYTYPRLQSPYPNYPTGGSPGAKVNFPQNANQGLFNSLAASRESAGTPTPSPNFQPEYQYDPILSRISAMGQMTSENARAEADALKKQAFISTGSGDLAQELGADQNTIDAASANSLSTEAKFKRDMAERAMQLDNSTNQNNLFYSGERVRQLEAQQRGALDARTNIGSSLRGVLSGLEGGVLAATEKSRMDALDAAWKQRIEDGLSGFYSPASGTAPTPPGWPPDSTFYDPAAEWAKTHPAGEPMPPNDRLILPPRTTASPSPPIPLPQIVPGGGPIAATPPWVDQPLAPKVGGGRSLAMVAPPVLSTLAKKSLYNPNLLMQLGL